jgi:two-component system, OmpR family, sensor kinase
MKFGGLLGRLPIRIRLTLAFTIAMAIVLSGVGYLVYAGLASAMDQSISDDLASRADLVKTYVLQADEALSQGAFPHIGEEQTSFVQILSASGTVIDGTPDVAGHPLLTPAQLTRASKGTFILGRVEVMGIHGFSRLLVTPVRAQDNDMFIVVGSSLEGRSEALAQLLTELLIGCPLALIVAAGLVFWLAGRALRPVEAIRKEAEAVSALEPGRKLPVPAAKDEIARLSVTLNEMLGRLESSLTRERSFVSNASHELRTPLSLLKAEVELALSRPRSNAELEEALRSMAGETDQLSQLVDGLLLLARVDAGRLPLRRTSIEGTELLEGIRERFSRRVLESGRTIDVAADPGVAFLGDRLLMQQVLSNLAENALRYGAGPIDLTALRMNDRVELHVKDRGPGFPPDFLPEAFDRFSRARPARSQSGAGLGLAIVSVIAVAHGGSAHAANRSDGGADVWVSLPADASQL